MRAAHISILGPKSFDASAVSPALISRSRDSTLPLLSRGLRPFPFPKRFHFSFKVPFVCADCIISVYWPGAISSNSKFPFSSVIEYLVALYCSGFPLVPSAVLVPTKFWLAGISTRPLTSHTLLPVSGFFPIWKSKKYVRVPLIRPVSGGCAVVGGTCDDGGGAAVGGSCDNVSAICPSP